MSTICWIVGFPTQDITIRVEGARSSVYWNLKSARWLVKFRTRTPWPTTRVSMRSWRLWYKLSFIIRHPDVDKNHMPSLLFIREHCPSLSPAVPEFATARCSSSCFGRYKSPSLRSVWTGYASACLQECCYSPLTFVSFRYSPSLNSRK